MNLPIPILSVLIGAVILFFGRKLFWLCVAAVGFAAGVEVAPHLVHDPSAILSLSVAIVFGFIGALLALFLQKVAIAVAGFLAGGKLALAIVTAFLVHGANYPGVTFIVGGIIGAILLLALFRGRCVFDSTDDRLAADRLDDFVCWSRRDRNRGASGGVSGKACDLIRLVSQHLARGARPLPRGFAGHVAHPIR